MPFVIKFFYSYTLFIIRCRKLHSIFPHIELAKKYSTIEAIMECEELKEFIKNKRVYESH